MQEKVENLLNQIYSQVDLKGDVFEFIQPHVMKAYGLLRSDALNRENNRTEQVVFRELEHQHRVEDILFRDLPGIVDIYCNLPLEYRNTHKLKSGKTHRELLMENIEILTAGLKEVETNAYEGVDRTMSVKNKLFKDKYVGDTNFINLQGGAVEYEKIEKTFDFSKVPKGENKLQTQDFSKDSNRKIVINEGSFQYQVKDKYRHFMKGTYNVFTKVAKTAGSVGLKALEGTAIVAGTAVLILVQCFPVTIIGGYIGYNYYMDRPFDHIEKANTIVKNGNELRSVSVMALEKLATDKGLELTVNQNGAQLVQTVGSGRCERTISNLEENSDKITMNYHINGQEMTNSKTLSAELKEGVCGLDDNKIAVTFKMK